MASEKRTSERLPANLPIDYSLDDQSIYLFHETLDISQAGVYIRTPKPQKVGTKLDMVFSVASRQSDVAAGRIIVKGQVIQAHPQADAAVGKGPGMGIKFLDLKNSDWKRLKGAATIESASQRIETGPLGTHSTEVIEAQLEMVRTHSKDLKKEASRYLKTK